MANGRRTRKTDPAAGAGSRKKRVRAAEGSDRKHLTGREVARLIEATKGSRNEARDRCLFLLMFRHGLRVSEVCQLKLDQVDTESRVLHVARLKGGLSSTQPLREDELRSPHAPACLRVRSCRSWGGYAAHTGLPRSPQHSAHRPVHGDEPGAV